MGTTVVGARGNLSAMAIGRVSAPEKARGPAKNVAGALDTRSNIRASGHAREALPAFYELASLNANIEAVG